MRRIAMFGSVVLLGICLTVIGAPVAGAVTNTPTLNSPASNDHIANIPLDYSLPDAVLPGSVRVIFTGTVSCILTMSDSATVSIVLAANDVTGNAAVVSSSCGSVIVDGNYMVTISYQNAAADPAALATTTNVEIDAVTAIPVTTSPASSTSYTHALPIAYSLPETPLAGSVRLVFSGGSSCTLTMTNATTANFTLDTVNVLGSSQVASSSCGSTIPDGTYAVVVSYQNSVSAPVATATRTAVVIAAAVAPTSTTTTTVPSTTTTTTTTTSLAAGAATTTSPMVAASTTTAPVSGVAGTGLAATGSSTGVPLATSSLGALLVGVGLLVLRRRRPGAPI